MKDDFDDDAYLTPEQKAELQSILDKFKVDVYDQIQMDTPTAEFFDDVGFDDLVKGYVLAQPNGSVMLAAWSWCWFDVVAKGRKVTEIMDK